MAIQDVLERKEILLKLNDMNNEEKALKIAKEYGIDFPESYSSAYPLCYKSAMTIAQWKDEQFYKFLLWLDDNFVIKRFTDGEPMTYSELIDNFKSNSYERDTTTKD